MDEMGCMEERWGKFQLNEEEKDSILIGDDFPLEAQLKESVRLIRKIHADLSSFKGNFIKEIMEKIWRLSKLAVFTKVGKNTFIITFAT